MKLGILLMLLSSLCYGQNKNLWNGKKCAVVLTYDDALNTHLDNVIPALDSVNLKATFYLSGYFPGCRERLKDWSKAAKGGHELANHTLFHPCEGNKPGRNWVKADYDLSTYSMTRLLDELKMTNVLLESIDGKKRRTFAYPCGDTSAGGQSYVDQIKNDFVSARGVKKEMVKINSIDLYNVPSYGINGETGEQLIELVEEAMAQGALIVFLFHGVGGEHNLNVSLDAHRQLLHYLKQKEKDVWITTFQDATDFAREHNSNK